MIRIKKFSWNDKDNEAKVIYQVDRGVDGEERHVLECSDTPLPDLLTALQGLAELALKECEVIRIADQSLARSAEAVFGKEKGQEYMDLLEKAGGKRAEASVRSVSWSWSLDIMGASICLLIPLSHSDQPLVVNTPHKPTQPYSGEAGHTLPADLADRLMHLHRLVERYIAGDRFHPQTDLFDEDAEAAP